MKCAYCNTNIGTPFTCKCKDDSIKYFCDMLCGRLYDITREPVQPLMQKYNQLYVKNRLSTSAKVTFERLNDYILFKMIPICTEKETPVDTKRYYNRLFGI